jgi:hypothetical protein
LLLDLVEEVVAVVRLGDSSLGNSEAHFEVLRNLVQRVLGSLLRRAMLREDRAERILPDIGELLPIQSPIVRLGERPQSSFLRGGEGAQIKSSAGDRLIGVHE